MNDDILFEHAENAGRIILKRYPFLDSVQVCVRKLSNDNIVKVFVKQDRSKLIPAKNYGEEEI